MGSFGGTAVFPLELGGEKTSVEKALGSIRGLLGVGGVSTRDDGIDAVRLLAIAIGLTAFVDFDERASNQFYPDKAIDLLPVYEEILEIVPGDDQTEDERRAAVVAAWTKSWSAEIPTLELLLQGIDSRFSILDVSWSLSTTTVVGRAFEPYVLTDQDNAFALGFGTKKYSDWPAYSTRDELYVLLDLGSGTIPNAEELRTIQRAKDLLDQVLPSWVRPYILTEVGLIAGVSPVGYAGVTGS